MLLAPEGTNLNVVKTESRAAAYRHGVCRLKCTQTEIDRTNRNSTAINQTVFYIADIDSGLKNNRFAAQLTLSISGTKATQRRIHCNTVYFSVLTIAAAESHIYA